MAVSGYWHQANISLIARIVGFWHETDVSMRAGEGLFLVEERSYSGHPRNDRV